MTFVRNLLSDLVAKKLWPAVVLLVVAGIAIPAILLTGREEIGPSIPLPAETATGVTPLVSVTEDGPRGGKGPIGRNPFRQPAAPKQESETTSSASEAGAVPATGAGVPGDTGGSLPGLDDIGVVPVDGGDDTGSTTDATAGTDTGGETEGKVSYAVDVRFGPDGATEPRRDLARLAPLPSQAEPYFVFLGVAADGETALFLIASDATATGDGVCKPSAEQCDRVELKAGQTAFFDVTTPTAETKRYQLDVAAVRKVHSADSSAATAARNRESRAGRAVLRNALETEQVNIGDIAYSRDLGLIVPAGGWAQTYGGLFGGYRVDLRFGSAADPAGLVKRYNLARLTPLPSVDDPSLVFLGVLSDGASAIFLNPAGAAASGDAVCDPSPDDCSRVVLKAGQSALLDVPTLDGTTAEYQLDVDAITPVKAASRRLAAAYRVRESKAGRVVLRRLITEVGTLVGDLNFSRREAVVVPSAGDQTATP
jgi:hypothetical protein